MEIFQTIWNALTTENIPLLNIINIPLVFIEMLVSMLIFTTILNISSNKKQKSLYVLLLSLIGLFTSWFVPIPYNTFINILACPICVYFIFKTTILKSILAEFLPYIFFIILGEIVVNIYTIMFNISNEVFSTTPIHKIIGSIFIYFFPATYIILPNI